MNKRIRVLFVSRWGLLCAFLLTVQVFMISAATAEEIQKPNIIFIMSDDVAWADIGFNGAKFNETPNIDAMARDGIVLDRFYPGGPNCAPSRACIVTGMYTPRHQLYNPGGKSKGDLKKMRWRVPARKAGDQFNTFQSNNNTIDNKWISIAETLKPAGYVTGRFGKWHLGDDPQGFDVSTNDGVNPFSKNKSSRYGDVDVARQLTDRTIKFMEDNQAGPFLIYLNHWEAHGPMKAKQDLIDKYKEKKTTFTGDDRYDWNPVFAAELEVVDRSVGRIRAKLKELAIDKNTIVIFTSDNGGPSQFTGNLPLHGAKGSLFEGGIRTACVAVWPGQIEAGTKTSIPVAGVDMLPTFAAIGGADLPDSQPTDGKSILSLLKGKENNLEKRSIFWHFPLYLSGSGYGKVLPIFQTQTKYWRGVPASAVMKGDWKLIHFFEYDRSALYNLQNDPGEHKDLYLSEEKIGPELKAELMAWIERTNAPVPTTGNTLFDPN